MYELMSECGKSVLLNELLKIHAYQKKLVHRYMCVSSKNLVTCYFLVLIAYGTNLPKYDFFKWTDVLIIDLMI